MVPPPVRSRRPFSRSPNSYMKLQCGSQREREWEKMWFQQCTMKGVWAPRTDTLSCFARLCPICNRVNILDIFFKYVYSVGLKGCHEISFYSSGWTLAPQTHAYTHTYTHAHTHTDNYTQAHNNLLLRGNSDRMSHGFIRLERSLLTSSQIRVSEFMTCWCDCFLDNICSCVSSDMQLGYFISDLIQKLQITDCVSSDKTRTFAVSSLWQ